MKTSLSITTFILILLESLNKEISSYSFNPINHVNSDIPIHPFSPPEISPDIIREKRQAYQVYVHGDVSVTVDKSGNAETGNWGQWNLEKECSRTCGGGVQIEKRQCNGDCTGPSTRYVSCNTEPCEGESDFRGEQCSKQNDIPFDGNYYKWLPYKGKNKCELTCKPENQKFYYKFSDKVIDGTKCEEHSDDICVEGVCLPLGCDGKLGSSLKKDKCGVCGGDSSTCKTVEGFFDERNLSPGYHDIIKLPVGATNIKIEEIRPTTNSLAIKGANGEFYLNGDNKLQPAGTTIRVGGVPFRYEAISADSASYEKLYAFGPLSEELTISLLFNRGNKDSAVRFEFSVPLEESPYLYKFDEWSSCSVTCGKGLQTRNIYCIDTDNGARVHDEMCEGQNVTKPDTEKPCETIDCEPDWYIGEWEPCTETCGDSGIQFRVVYCHSTFADGRKITIDDGNCTDIMERPETKQNCNRFSCPEWQAGPWSACSEKCGPAKQYRSVTCRSEKESEEGKLLPADACNSDGKMESERECNLGPCEGLNFVTGDWKVCQKCNDTQETREVSCQDTNGRKYALEKCLTGNITKIPDNERSCATPKPCIYEWTTSQWSKCSTECGHGHQTRKVVCAISELGEITIVDEGLCNGQKPENKQNCTNEEKCTGTYFTGPWSNCSETCGGGTQTRMIVCLNYDKQPVPEWCDESVKPVTEQECNVEKCKTCEDGEFGCCPDGVTEATGKFNEGCSNCTVTEFGCCNDNVTIATGPNGKGCPEYIEQEASGEEIEKEESKENDIGTTISPDDGTSEPTEEPKMCMVKNEETGEEAEVPCASAISANEDGEFPLPENKTIHCSDTEFGCCPDWYTPATGKNFEGCPQFVLGSCADTEHGCCLDNVTLSRGPNLEGCGDPTCAASLFGCCKDRKTIAFGTHYAGCDRSSFPCELTEFGCCADGETAALGKNGTGCGANCLLTKFGCCPDMATVAKGVNNEGCGCQYAKYGCCPDGKSEAKGLNFIGCPESCATSQFGCCPDGKTPARGTRNEGCPCQYTRWGCCSDGETAARGPNSEGCDNCHYSKYGCCHDGLTAAKGKNYEGCPATTVAPFLVGGTVDPLMIQACSLPHDRGTFCGSGYKLMYYFDTESGDCTAFWYSGCEGNKNRFASADQCKTVCIEPPGKGRCLLPKHEGNQNCQERVVRYAYDARSKSCVGFWYSGCGGNANSFASWNECKAECEDVEFTVENVSEEQNTDNESGEHNVETMQPQPQHEEPQTLENPQRPPNDFNDKITQMAIDDARKKQEEIERETREKAEREKAERDRLYQEQLRKHYEAIEQRKKENEERQSQQPSSPRTESLQYPQQPQISNHIVPKKVFKKSEACSLPKQIGRCRGNFPSYYYEIATGTCIEFMFSGCGGNANRFHTKELCENACMKPTSAEEETPSQVQPQSTSSISLCDLDKDSRQCSSFTPKWYYNKKDGTCSRFHWGGCEGNSNKFDTEEECKQTCGNHISACKLPKVTGPCAGKNEFYYFNRDTQKCETFIYGGCLGNINRFDTLAACQAVCPLQSKKFEALTLHVDSNKHYFTNIEIPRKSDDLKGYDVENNVVNTNIINTNSSLPELCMLPEDPGICFGSELRFRYDSDTSSCVSFFYTGCNGNANHFTSIESCERACGKYRNQDVCLLPKHSGNCDSAKIPKFYYDSQKNECTLFFFGDCDGNGNRFSTKSECEFLCRKEVENKNIIETEKNICLLERDSGPCTDSISQWYFDKNEGICKKFTYGGCRGNGNRFDTKEACKSSCENKNNTKKSESLILPSIYNSHAFICSLPMQKGSCRSEIDMYYYNSKDKKCHLFKYSGCGGSLNKFNTKKDCENTCNKTKEITNEEILPIVKVNEDDLILIGHNILMTCDVDKKLLEKYIDSHVTWYKNSKLIPHSENIIYSGKHNETMEIIKSSFNDTGFYSCSIGDEEIESMKVYIFVNAPMKPKHCRDIGNKEVCTNAFKNGQCQKKRYKTFCCETCKQFHYKF
uniref:Papilin (inferred by orthology to a D. melanogaster protein) n=1 Tax=Strongyloides venezuelensis TaxID=75913 RepID=A0A0K0FAQ1_STRVS